MKVLPYANGKYFTIANGDAIVLDVISGPFPTIEALENHIKLMLIAVQNYNSKISQPVQQDDWTFDEPIDYSARYYHE